MAVVSSLVVFAFGLMLIKFQNDTKVVVDEPQVTLEVIKFVLCFAFLVVFFKVFSFVKSRSILIGILNVLLFFIILFVVFMLVEDNLQYLSEKLNPLSVKQWTENGYLPPEEEMSDSFFWLISSCLVFVNVLLLNLLPTNSSIKRKVGIL